ncbi:MAG: Uma2 family endonuclease [Planctomycetota bacterium]|nr:Uma2 family endonuclease [Planctomycetota bacterium]MDA1247830.1 Uma2 family endonuclease [Planctomycetota bacterium]
MSTATPDKSDRMTAKDLLALSDEKNYELVDGKLVELNMSGLSSEVAMILAWHLMNFVRPQGLGSVFGSDCGYQCFSFAPQQVRKPDVSFVAVGRISDAEKEAGYVRVAPDLAVEVISPSDGFHNTEEKVAEYLSAGVRLVWIIDPLARIAIVHRQDASYERLGADGSLSGEDVLPGFECRITDLLPPSSAN